MDPALWAALVTVGIVGLLTVAFGAAWLWRQRSRRREDARVAAAVDQAAAEARALRTLAATEYAQQRRKRD